jgi:hypothetical protein
MIARDLRTGRAAPKAAGASITAPINASKPTTSARQPPFANAGDRQRDVDRSQRDRGPVGGVHARHVLQQVALRSAGARR